MWQRGMNWAATSFVGVFGFLWLGVVVFAAVDVSAWSRLGQGGFSTFLMGWACYKASVLLRRAEAGFTPRHRRVRT
ncbi:hypothetical protein Plo01_39020 [Planobispora longispora]|uniref:Uncharacterized protein n=1 Tax=Planobispora longispora TaxID=28887 RepID=A0A8J3RSH6_9ACTN|nr:hypothetical protein Plo01_39020 [Planobispora longispora]